MQTGAVTLRCLPHRKGVLNADHSKIILRCNAFADGEHCRTAGARRNAYTPTPKENIPVRANSTSGAITVVISITNGARAQPTGTDVGRGTLLPTDGMRCIPKRLIPSKLCGRSTFPENAPCGQFAAWESVPPREPPPAWFRRHSCERLPQSLCP